MYLMIQNTGVAPLEAFTIFGLSTARGNSAKIGQFGSGNKHAVNVLLRKKIKHRIFLGLKELSFGTTPKTMGNKPFELINYTFDGKTVDTTQSLEFGALDWDSPHMALREFISNAIDSVGFENVLIDVVDEIVEYADATTIYVELTPEIEGYYNNLSQYFLHFNHTGVTSAKVMKKDKPSKARIYRKGVFVMETPTESLFDYNLGEETKIDEARNMSIYAIQYACEKILCNSTEVIDLVQHLAIGTKKLWENEFNSYRFDSKCIIDAWDKLYGSTVPCDSERTANIIAKKGKKTLVVPGIDFLKGIMKTGQDYLSESDSRGVTEVAVQHNMRRKFLKIWGKIEKMGLSGGKPMPTLRAFARPVFEDGTTLCGFQDENDVWINIESNNEQTHLEEIAHYITGCCDGTREFQSFAFSVAALLI